MDQHQADGKEYGGAYTITPIGFPEHKSDMCGFSVTAEQDGCPAVQENDEQKVN